MELNATLLDEQYNGFVSKYPLSGLRSMPLKRYTNGDKDSFIYDLEFGYVALGKISGTSALIHGLYYSPKEQNEETEITYRKGHYVWKKTLGEDVKTAYNTIINAIADVAEAASRNDWKEVDNNTIVQQIVKWKIAFLYSDKKLLPIYSREMLNKAGYLSGIEKPENLTIAEIQKRIIDIRGNRNLFEFSIEILQKVKNMSKISYWIYAPGENACKWDDCLKQGIMMLGWDEIGDYSDYKSKGEIKDILKRTYKDSSNNPVNNANSIWSFVSEMNVGDIIYVKNGLSKIVGRGIVKGEYYWDEETEKYKSRRQVEWTHVGEWNAGFNMPVKTLTNITKLYDVVEKMENLFEFSNKQYFWLNSNPKYWKVSEMSVGEEQNYTILNENGNKRVKAECFQKAKAGDLLIGYETTPTLKIAAILQITKPNDGESIWFKCIEQLPMPVSYDDIKLLPILQEHPIVKNSNGSLFELTEEQYNSIINVIRRCNPVENAYSKQDFLNEVFISEDNYENMKGLLELKQNIILQGVPGVGKTFCAKRLCYSLTGKRDDSKICMVQFHQNYSYEDFVMGYKPNGEGFELQTGIFYDFCKKAREDTSNNYYIIIDEINRGNLSKIFGELLMLIEKDYRGEKNAIHLAYKKDELFYVPKNLYIIGMMNTADRSLAMMDYALRRRFCFFDMKPCFDNEAFKLYTDNLKSDSFNNVIEAIKRLNQTITDDDSLGEGFVIGHSYFCNQKSVENKWLERVVKYEIEPMIREYWFDNKEKAETECSKLEDSL